MAAVPCYIFCRGLQLFRAGDQLTVSFCSLSLPVPSLSYLCLLVLVARFLFPFTCFFHLRLFFNSALLSCLTVSMLSSLLAASLKQMRTLRCGRRYTGLASQPCSVHHTDIRCTEPLTNQPSVILFNPSAFACLLLLLLLLLTIIPYIRLLLKSTAQTSAAFLWSRGYV